MQTCKELPIYCFQPPTFLEDGDDRFIHDPYQRIVIPSGTYVKRTVDRFNPKDKMYRVMPWRGMPKQYKKMVDYGVLLSHAQVKGKF